MFIAYDPYRPMSAILERFWQKLNFVAFGKLVFLPNCSLLRYGTMIIWEVVHTKCSGLTFEEIETKVTLFFNDLLDL